MIEYFLWIVSFIGLFVGIFWAYVEMMPSKEENLKLKSYPLVSLIIPAWNEEKTLEKTVKSLLSLEYPKKKLQIIIVNDGSVDSTKQVAEKFIASHKSWNIELVNRQRSPGQFTKAPALNAGLKRAKGEFVGCLDSDSTVKPDALKKMLPLFESGKTGAVITAIKVANPVTLWSRIQRIEYILATFIRNLMSKVETLHITPGALSLYRTEVIKSLGGFDEKNITEDYEIAMRLKYNGYNIKINSKAVSFTAVPETFKGLWNQRVRWFRGFIVTMRKYKKMFGNHSLGMMGVFQYPLNLISFITVLLAFGLSCYVISSNVYHWFVKLYILRGGIFEIMKMPSLSDYLLQINWKVMFPIVVSFAVGIYIYHLAHRHIGERWKHPFTLAAYFIIYPPIRTTHWMAATFKEMFRRKSRW